MYYIYRVDAISLAYCEVYCAARAGSHKLVLLFLQGGEDIHTRHSKRSSSASVAGASSQWLT